MLLIHCDLRNYFQRNVSPSSCEVNLLLVLFFWISEIASGELLGNIHFVPLLPPQKKKILKPSMQLNSASKLLFWISTIRWCVSFYKAENLEGFFSEIVKNPYVNNQDSGNRLLWLTLFFITCHVSEYVSLWLHIKYDIFLMPVTHNRKGQVLLGVGLQICSSVRTENCMFMKCLEVSWSREATAGDEG